LHVAPVL